VAFSSCTEDKMSIHFALILFIGLGGPSSPAPIIQTPQPVPVNVVILTGGTPITFSVVDNVSSGTAKVGDTFGVRVAKDVVIDGYVAVAQGADGMGEVTSVDPAGSHGHAGSLGIQLDWVHDVGGDKVKLTEQKKSQEGQGEQGASSTATLLTYVLLGPLGLFTHNFVKGHDIVLTPDSTVQHPLTAYVDVSVYVTRTTPESAGFASPVPEAPQPSAPPR
jgi:hypothetical protein